MKTIEVQIPDGKDAKWVNGVLTLVDEAPKNIMERVKTFEDACDVLGAENPLVKQYVQWINASTNNDEGSVEDVDAYLKLRIITAALNEGWVPTFDKDEYRWYAWYVLLTREELDEISDEAKVEMCVIERPNSSGSYCGLGCSASDAAWAPSGSYLSARLAFKSSELAEYAGKQFIEIYADYCFKAKE